MKLWQKMTGALAVCSVLVCGAFVAACSEQTDNPETTEPAEITTSWQFTGAYNRTVDHGLYESFGEFEILMNLMSDGNGEVNFYFIGSGIKADEEWSVSLTWKTETDRDGLTLMTIKDGISPAGKYEIYQESDGTFEISNYYMPLGKGSTYHREPTLIGSSVITYATVDDWRAEVKTKYENMKDEGGEELKQAILTLYTEDKADSIEFYEDGTAKISAFSGKIKFDYTWTLDGETITLTSKDKPDEKIVSTSENGVTSLVYSGNLGGNEVNLTYTGSDISALSPKAIVTFAADNGTDKVEFYADKTALLIAFGGRVKFQYTWEVNGETITLTSKDKPDEKIVSTSKDGITTLSYTATFAGGQVLVFNCADISALKA